MSLNLGAHSLLPYRWGIIACFLRAQNPSSYLHAPEITLIRRVRAQSVFIYRHTRTRYAFTSYAHNPQMVCKSFCKILAENSSEISPLHYAPLNWIGSTKKQIRSLQSLAPLCHFFSCSNKSPLGNSVPKTSFHKHLPSENKGTINITWITNVK